MDVDDSKERKSRHPLSGRNICSILTDFGTSAVKTLPSRNRCEFCLDVENLETGYVYLRCFRELNNLQKQLKDRHLQVK